MKMHDQNDALSDTPKARQIAEVRAVQTPVTLWKRCAIA